MNSIAAWERGGVLQKGERGDLDRIRERERKRTNLSLQDHRKG